MNKFQHIVSMFVAGFSLTGWAQLVPNGSFENGTLPTSSASYGTTIDAATGLPNWNISGSSLYYQYGPLGGPVIAITSYYSPSAGSNSVFLQAGFGGAPTPVSMWQNLSIPSNIKTITFQSKSLYDTNLYHGYYLALLVSAAGVSISPLNFSTDSSGYMNYGIDVSAYAGSTMELRFLVDPLGGNIGGAYQIDNIQYSSTPVPEPGTLTLLGVGGVMLGLQYCRKKCMPSTSTAALSAQTSPTKHEPTISKRPPPARIAHYLLGDGFYPKEPVGIGITISSRLTGNPINHIAARF